VAALDDAMAQHRMETERPPTPAPAPPSAPTPPPPPEQPAAGASPGRARRAALPLIIAVLLAGAAGAFALRELRQSAGGPGPTASLDILAAPPSAAPPPAPAVSASTAPGETAAPAAANHTSFVLDVRLRLLRLVEANDAPAAAAPLLSLVDADPSVFRDPEVQRAAASVAVKLETQGGELADKVYYALTYRLGSAGLDVLYAIIEAGKSTRASARASAILGHEDVIVRAAGPLQIAFELRRTPCQHKPLLFERAGKEGDSRALLLLETLRSPQCDATRCCYRYHEQLDAAVSRIRARTP
jgi:hypothetical protein